MSGFGVIINWLASFWHWVETGFTWILDGFITLLQFVVFTILDGLFLVVETALAAINLSSILFNYAAAWSNLPTQLIWLINAVGLPQCFALLGAAYLIRLTLNLIPSVFTRVWQWKFTRIQRDTSLLSIVGENISRAVIGPFILGCNTTIQRGNGYDHRLCRDSRLGQDL